MEGPETMEKDPIEEDISEPEEMEAMQRSSATVVSALTNPSAVPHGDWGTPVGKRHKTKPQDPAKPLFSEGSVSASSSYDPEVHKLEGWLRCNGWKIQKGNGLVSWYWVRPGRSFKDGTEGIDFFKSIEEVEEFVLKSSEQKGNAKNKKTKKVDKKKLSIPQGNTKITKRKNAADDKGSKAKKAKASVKKNPKKQEKTSPSNCFRILRIEEAKRLLRKSGFEENTNPEKWSFSTENESFVFKSITGLRKFLCMQGIPAILLESMGESLEKNEVQQIDRWIRFGNVPLSAEGIEEVIKKSKSPPNIHQFLVIGNGIETLDGDYYLPKSDFYMGHYGRRRGVHFFDGEKQLDQFRAALRGWTLCGREQKFERLALWAAKSSEPLPEFNLVFAKRYYKFFQDMVEERWDAESNKKKRGRYDEKEVEENESREESEESEAEAIGGRKGTSCNDDQLDIDDDKGVLDHRSPEPKSQPSTKMGKKNKGKRRSVQWYEDQTTDSQAIPLLEKLGFRRKNNQDGWYHPHIHESTIMKLQVLRKFILFCGVPHVNQVDTNARVSRKARIPTNDDFVQSKLGEKDLAIFMKWLHFAYFPHDKLATDLVKETLARLECDHTMQSIHQQLSLLNFHSVDGKFFPPESDNHRRENKYAERHDGFHVLKDAVAQIEYLLSTPTNSLMPSKSATDSNPKCELFLRLWAIQQAVKNVRNRPTLPVFSCDSPRFKFFMDHFFPSSK